ncbi:putative reverse transcriptase zinc-binding domain-containing protein [Helianthus annuus]|nr:putative reverse transcriptase zinc-binding domain-containing protein [Helianthus annuus]
MAKNLNCQIGSLPFNFLGIPIGANMKRVKYWKPIVDRFNSKLSSWKVKVLSMAGRIVLAKAVLGALPNYFLSMFVAPKKVIKVLESIRRDFVWGKKNGKCKMRWVAWKKVVKAKGYGGLGVGDIRSANLALLAKWWWKYKDNPRALWAEVIESIHSKRNSTSLMPIKFKLSGTWKDIMGIEKEFEKMGLSLNKQLTVNVGNGCKVKFWLDTWVGSGPFKERFPAIYALAKNKNCKVSECVKRIGEIQMWDWAWKRGTRSDAERSQHAELTEVLKNISLKENEDIWKWNSRPNEELTVAVIRDAISRTSLEANDMEWKFWNRWAPPKVNLFVWRAAKNKIPVKMELFRRGINIEDMRCSRCGRDEETIDHLLVDCVMAQATWWNVKNWLKLPNNEELKSCEKMLQYIQDQIGSKEWKQVIMAIFMIAMWQIWKSRNEVVFNGRNGSVTRTVDEIKELSFLWIKERSKLKGLEWERWKDFNIRDIIK